MTLSATPDISAFAVVGRLIDDGRELGDGAVVVDEHGRIAAIEVGARARASASAARLPSRIFAASVVSAGFVDLQVNGSFGFEVQADTFALSSLARRLPERGVTAFLPTLVSLPEPAYLPVFAALAAAMRDVETGRPRHASRFAQASNAPAARMLGLHLEGPLLSVDRAGAHDHDAIDAATPESLARLLAQAEREAVPIRLLTLAPERAGALPLIAKLCAAGVAVSLGHTDATFETARAAIDAGARLATHVFNAMPPLHHRHPGPVAAVLTDDRVTALFIPDGVHVHPAVLQLALRAKPPHRRAIVTDAVSAAAMPAGARARLAGQTLSIDSTSARLADGTLAGSILTMDRAVRNCVSQLGLSVPEALRMATAVPADAIGARGHGRLSVGAPADLVLLDPDLDVVATLIDGAFAYVRGGNVDALRA